MVPVRLSYKILNFHSILLICDELVDQGIMLECDPNNIVSRVHVKTEDIPLSEQTVTQVSVHYIHAYNKHTYIHDIHTHIYIYINLLRFFVTRVLY